MSRIFISYRREDSSGYAGRLNDCLNSRFGEHDVFMDIDAIEPGVDYQDVIENTIDTIDVMVVLIGRHWLTAVAPTGSRRLDDPDDLVRLEVAGALERKIRVIPVLVQGAAMPTVHDLPPPLIPLAHRNAIEISDSRWEYDCERLVSVLERALGRPATQPVAKSLPTPLPNSASPERPASARQDQRALIVVGATAAAAVLVWGVLAPRNWHAELAGLRMGFEAILVATVLVGLWLKQWKWVVGGGLLGVLGLTAWAQLLLSNGHSMSDLVTSPDGASNILAFVASTVTLGTGLVGTRAEHGFDRAPA